MAMLVSPGRLMNPAPLPAPAASAYAKRAQEVTRVFAAETTKSGSAALSGFLLSYFAAEALAKIVQGAGTGIPPAKALGRSVDLRSLKPALAKFEITVDGDLLDRVFLSAEVKPSERSARKIRDKVVHELSGGDIKEINVRGRTMIKDMKGFITAVEQASKKRKF